jgi:RNA ligase
MTEEYKQDVPKKPLGHKGYGSIPHLPGSRLGPGDHHCHAGQEVICWTKARDKNDRIIVTEKLDGSNVTVARIGDYIVALGRAGYLAQTSKYEQHQLFATWVREREALFRKALAPGFRFVGEWMAQAHGTRYQLPHEPLVVFDLMRGQQRLSHDLCRDAARDLPCAAVLHDGGPIGRDAILLKLVHSNHGAIDPVEGAVWRVERRGEFDFIAKWVRPDKRDGSYLPEISGLSAHWNWRP